MATTVTTTTTMATTTATKAARPSSTARKAALVKLNHATLPHVAVLPPPLLASARGTPFERCVWALIYQIPAGSFSTYALLAAYMKTSPRAVGNALRRNPFAPEVPCHRIVAADKSLGGFKGKIARRDGEGITLAEKRTLLRGEGVKFDVAGDKVLGTPWQGFHV